MLTEKLQKLIKWEYSGLCLLVIIVLILHFTTISYPADISFDEKYYVPSARSILEGTGTGQTEHPPLGQLLIAYGIYLFGDNPFGWRFFSVIFGTISIIFFYLICRRLNMSRVTSFLATSLIATENLNFVQASVGMLDVYSLTFMLMSFWFYLKGWYAKTGVAVGLATLAKMSGVLALPVIFLHWLFTKRDNISGIAKTIVMSMVSFIIFLTLSDLIIWQKLLNPIHSIKHITMHTMVITFKEYSLSPIGAEPTRPWEWLILRNSIAHIRFDSSAFQFYAIIELTMSPLIWLFTIPSMVFTFIRALKRDSTAIFLSGWFACTYFFWIPVTLITDRLTYSYYIYPTIGAICISLVQLIAWLSGTRGKAQFVIIALIISYLCINLFNFITLIPGIFWVKTLCIIPLCYLYFYYFSKVRSGHISII
jgi:predicted membrane-bound dolichyl-phosphate-mannose-protein mannosyltransferase